MIGQLHDQVTIQSVSQSTDGMGGYTEAWGTHATVFAKIEPASGSELWFASQRQMRTTHTITIRYLSTITSKMRILFESRAFHIHAIRTKDERKRYMILTCEEGAAS